MANLSKFDFNSAYFVRKSELTAKALLENLETLTADEIKMGLISIVDDSKGAWKQIVRNDDSAKDRLFAIELTARQTPGTLENKQKLVNWKREGLLSL
jgi:hypothetical protein